MELICFSDAHTAWKYWNLIEFEQRFEILSCCAEQLKAQDKQLAAMMQFHLEAARPLTSVCQELHGPTGETNELYMSGRGVSVLFLSSVDSALAAGIALLSSALITGNSVVISSNDNTFVSILKPVMTSINIPEKLIQFVSEEAGMTMLSSDIRSVGFVGNESDEKQLNRALAQRHGAIVGLVSETDMENLPVAHDPYLSLRFATERTRTINITAIGGNASLLEVGHSPH
ncbi:1-pyrroline-5-carboxylate dehydrogenase [Vibrio quintilis]|uniref:Bifunctional proline dehydrogenase/pyrroline-5-carboxylate dehydrogenase n=1 Tax=Vibrio quintilis TaxID=1117707 RepID=A0A1M7YPK4_9VIBR|nr:1-pyrroline-5-carboxylate dehydrogenase [Vibrio quintilis]SHO54541.1 bifunctional proline dehydrogenase/pyrroline-5-carboxylate dehydrogenase [Vibrio quintilis]